MNACLALQVILWLVLSDALSVTQITTKIQLQESASLVLQATSRIKEQSAKISAWLRNLAKQRISNHCIQVSVMQTARELSVISGSSPKYVMRKLMERSLYLIQRLFLAGTVEKVNTRKRQPNCASSVQLASIKIRIITLKTTLRQFMNVSNVPRAMHHPSL